MFVWEILRVLFWGFFCLFFCGPFISLRPTFHLTATFFNSSVILWVRQLKECVKFGPPVLKFEYRDAASNLLTTANGYLWICPFCLCVCSLALDKCDARDADGGISPPWSSSLLQRLVFPLRFSVNYGAARRYKCQKVGFFSPPARVGALLGKHLRWPFRRIDCRRVCPLLLHGPSRLAQQGGRDLTFRCENNGGKTRCWEWRRSRLKRREYSEQLCCIQRPLGAFPSINICLSSTQTQIFLQVAT